MADVQLPSDRHLRFHRRQWVIYLLGCIAMAVGTIIAVLMPGDDDARVVLIPTFGFFGLMVVLSAIEQVRRRTEFEREKERIWTDEWMLRGLHRSLGFALRTVIFAQVPLMFFMAYVPAEPSVVGMGVMTVALGCATWAASYLHYTRASTDG